MLFKNKIIIIFNVFLILILFFIGQNSFRFSSLKFKNNYFNNHNFESINLDYSKNTLNKLTAYYKASFVKVEKVDNIIIGYYFSPLLEKQIESENKTFNLQIIIKDNKMQVCYPINYLSF